MARRRRRRRDQGGSQDFERDLLTPNRSLAPLHRIHHVTSPSLIEDRRTHHPLQFFRPAKTYGGSDAGPAVPKQTKNSNKAFLARGLKFPGSGSVMVCVRRKQRKEILHAMKKVGRGRGRGRKRRNWYSNIGC